MAKTHSSITYIIDIAPQKEPRATHINKHWKHVCYLQESNVSTLPGSFVVASKPEEILLAYTIAFPFSGNPLVCVANRARIGHSSSRTSRLSPVEGRSSCTTQRVGKLGIGGVLDVWSHGLRFDMLDVRLFHTVSMKVYTPPHCYLRRFMDVRTVVALTSI